MPLSRLFDAFQPMTVALSIMLAAILVRLNRGMPTLDWKSLEPQERSQLTSAIVDLTREYAFIVGIKAALVTALVSLAPFKLDAACWSNWTSRGVAAAIGAMVALSVSRMAYVVWRDYDIVKLQKMMIDSSGVREKNEGEVKLAEAKISGMRASGLRKVDTIRRDPLE
ncbi:hypothetical protein [Azospirillum thiophilum]|uniref:hypothetical protein n=1 Tax=Azospirillum thiophilum TaxID=528244 RepID=UPI001FDF0D22|nr:hypothetical protein [Azospirillum thiophilum]